MHHIRALNKFKTQQQLWENNKKMPPRCGHWKLESSTFVRRTEDNMLHWRLIRFPVRVLRCRGFHCHYKPVLNFMQLTVGDTASMILKMTLTMVPTTLSDNWRVTIKPCSPRKSNENGSRQIPKSHRVSKLKVMKCCFCPAKRRKFVPLKVDRILYVCFALSELSFALWNVV